MDFENALVTKIVKERDIRSVLKQKITSEFFYDTVSKAAFQWLCDWYRNPKYGDTPSWEIFIETFEGWEGTESHDSLPALCEQVRKRKLYSDLSEVIQHVADATITDPMDGFEQLKQQVSRLSINHTVNQATSVTEQLGKVKSDYLRMKSLDPSMKLRGLPYPWPTLNGATMGVSPGNVIVYYGRPKTLKAQPINSEVLTPSGFRPIGSLHVGDTIIGSNGRPCKVTGVYPQGVKPVFRVTTSDGASTRCCDDHLWLTQTRRGAEPVVRPLSEIRETLQLTDGRNNHRLPVVSPVHFAKASSEPLPLHPYLLGILLGDGNLRQDITVTNVEEDILKEVEALLPSGDTCTRSNSADRATSIRIKRKKRNNQKSDTAQALERLELLERRSHEKFIPRIYLYSSLDDRLDLLRGLLDTDGCVIGPRVVFSTASEMLRDDVVFLARSLGALVTTGCVESPTYAYKGEVLTGKPSYRATVRFPNNELCPGYSEKTVSRWKPDAKPMLRTIATVEPAGEEECVCIAVDAEDRQYVTDDFLVTHNTWEALNTVKKWNDHGSRVCVFSQELSDEEMARRYVALVTGVDYRDFCRGELSYKEEQDFFSNLELFAERPPFDIDVIENYGSDIEIELSSKIDEMGYTAIMIDGAHYIGRDWKELGAVTKTAKRVAKNKNLPILLTTHAHRRGGKVEVGGPADDVAHSDSFFQDCDLAVRFLREKEQMAEKELIMWTSAVREGDNCAWSVHTQLCGNMEEKRKINIEPEELPGDEDLNNEEDQAMVDAKIKERKKPPKITKGSFDTARNHVRKLRLKK